MIEYFTEQIDGNKRVTEESLIEFNDKTYHSGRVMSVGDIVLFAFLDLGGDTDGKSFDICKNF
jgi:hypothetical protein